MMDKLFEKGRKKLYDEIDLLKIIKQLRVNSFTNDLLLKPYQKDLVRWFEQYMISLD